MKVPNDLRYTKEHEWVRMNGNIATIGITDYAQSQLGDIVYLDVDTIEDDLEADEVFGSVEAVKTVSDLYMPLAGTVTELNEALEDNPEVINTDPYGDGWMIKITVTNPADYNDLLDAEAYTATIKG